MAKLTCGILYTYLNITVNCILLVVMNVTSTPVSSTTSKKRELTSPEDLSELKKNRLLSESSKSDISDISNLSIMADQEGIRGPH